MAFTGIEKERAYSGINSMRKNNIAFLLLGILSLVLVMGCSPEDPVPGSLYTQDIAPGTSDDYDVGEADNPYAHGYFDSITLSGSDPIALEGDAKVWIKFRPDIDYRLVRAQGTPTWVERGAFGGFSLPIYAANNEELFLDMCLPDRWDGETNPFIHFDVWLDTAQDSVKDAFRLQVSYNHFTPNVDIVPNTFTDDLEIETLTGISAQYQSYQLDFELPILTKEADDILGFRLRRIGVVVNSEMDGEVIIEHAGIIFLCDKLGSLTP